MAVENIQACDLVCRAAETGRFDLVTILLAIVAIILAVGGIFAFIDVRRSARSTAKAEAETVSREIAEAAAVAYLERELPRLIPIYQELARNAVRDEDANAIAEAQENPDGGNGTE